MSVAGTRAYEQVADLPALVAEAVRRAAEAGFETSCRPEQGRLLRVLAGGAKVRVGESGTGYGVGIAWLLGGLANDVPIVSVERDDVAAQAAKDLYANHDQVTIINADWRALYDHGPYDLLILDGGGQGKADSETANVDRLLLPGGTLVIDDFTPTDSWPPMHDGEIDTARTHWLEHPLLNSVELRLAEDLASIVAVRKPASI
jgi:predicted O-methyltransferase YrrM